MSTASPARPVANLINQHVSELAFTWQRRLRAWSAPNHRAAHLHEIDSQLDAHLDGLQIAGREALAPAMQRFKRWGTDEEAFAAAAVVGLCATDAADEATRLELDSLLIANPRSAGGAAAALFWISETRALPLLQRWWTSDQRVLWRAAFPACLPNPQVRRPHLIDDALLRSDGSLQARALRAIGEWRITERAERLPAFANGDDPLLREEAIYALRLLGYGERLPHCPAPTLLDRPSRRRWLSAFALTAPADSVHAAFDVLSAHSREREALWLAICRADAWALSKLDAALDGKLATLAAFGIEQLTGLDLERDQLWQRPDTNPARPLSKRSPADEGEHADERPTASAQKHEPKAHLEDQGLLEPHVEKLRAALRNPLRPAAEPHLQGESLPMRLYAASKATLQGEAGALHRVREPLFKLL
ncbi:MAG: hypothetical protein H4O13_04025 [Xanthomonadales bacterium]|nr:hypothetical protein [Xanthomonadales bacterium]